MAKTRTLKTSSLVGSMSIVDDGCKRWALDEEIERQRVLYPEPESSQQEQEQEQEQQEFNME